ncbi:HD-GYP domain-containing protein [Geomesophilobacter sediminis]|uniref:PAS domain S-box protein n=1 Tax=Geomesophilobacter sediminis TaxID=2798584 RepID=A0A8J7J2R9_9BACT|nr:HD domain-containing phosphohydrolase [Geomesophilobacter sediminis]MBJ6725083.1 PAS domain S-box protein [Geomesophilobacter sediminis]
MTGNVLPSTQWKRGLLGSNEKHLVALVKASPLGIIAFDLEGKIILWNHAAEDITGWLEAEVLDLPIQILAGPNWEEYEALRRRTLNREVFHSLPMEAATKDGRTMVISYSSAPVFDSKNRVVATMAVIYDMTEKIAKMKLESQLKESLGKMNRILGETVQALSYAVEKRDPYTAGHQHRVAQLACALAEELGGEAVQSLDAIWTAAILHDVGKLYVPAEILTRPGQLTRIEMELIKSHAEVGYEMLKNIEFPWPVPLIVHQHHERLDGSGYPAGVMASQILLESRILAVADVVEAMSSHRPYRLGKGLASARDEIWQARGTAYDPAVVDACIRLIDTGFVFCDHNPRNTADNDSPNYI